METKKNKMELIIENRALIQSCVSVSAGLSESAKIDFEDWLLKTRNQSIKDGDIEYDLYYMSMYMLPDTCVNALIIEFLDTKLFQGISLWEHSFSFYYKHKIESQSFNDVCIQAIEKANEIYNMYAEH